MKFHLNTRFHLQTFALLIFFFALAPFERSQGYWIRDHEAIVNEAVRELEACKLLPLNLQGTEVADLISGDTSEDYNLLRKWIRYSHFYNPRVQLEMIRADSTVTISESVQEIQTILRSAEPSEWTERGVYRLLGRIAHHLQDATVPTHVVPVGHWLNDGFESLPVDLSETAEIKGYFHSPANVQVDLDSNSDLRASPQQSPTKDCLPIAEHYLSSQPINPEELLRRTAESTLIAIQKSVTFIQDEVPKSKISRWDQLFWKSGELISETMTILGDMLPYDFKSLSETQPSQPPPEDLKSSRLSFGTYGEFGNNFGQETFSSKGKHIRINPDVYLRFKKDRLEDAIRATQLAIRWLNDESTPIRRGPRRKDPTMANSADL